MLGVDSDLPQRCRQHNAYLNAYLAVYPTAAEGWVA